MNTKLIDAIANAVLYEGYMLYPYRASSVKNRQRFNFGVLYPKSYSDSQSGSDLWGSQTECLVQGGALTAIEVRVRFLRLVERSLQKLIEFSARDQISAQAAFEPVSSLSVDDRVFAPWQEAIECEVSVPVCNLDELTRSPVQWQFDYPATQNTELLRDVNNKVTGQILRQQLSVMGAVEIKAERLDDELFRVRVRVQNLTALDDEVCGIEREQSLMRSLVSAHTLLGAVDGEFISLLDPPPTYKDCAASCQNVGTWPVLVGSEGEHKLMLSSPVILYDYPQIAPESPGDLFDGTEIDEILALRILTLTESEKKEMRDTDERSRRILERTETLPMEQLAKLHGTLREIGSLKRETL